MEGLTFLELAEHTCAAQMAQENHKSGTVLVIKSDGMGQADLELGQRWLRRYLETLLMTGLRPDAICLCASGVKLATEGSPVLDLLEDLEEKGSLVLSCATSLNQYGLAEQVKVGVLGGMRDLVAAQWEAHKVISL